jgi:ribonuclease BN (tRNA processing enzyme)
MELKQNQKLSNGLKLTILGSGTNVPELDRHGAGYLVQTEKLNLVFDFGRGVLDGLLKQGLNYADINVIFITHFHADHFSELSTLLFLSLTEPPGRELRTKDLIIYGPQGFKERYNYLEKAFDLKKYKPKYQIIVKELKDKDVVKINNTVIKSYKVEHSQSHLCLSYRIESAGKILIYGGDSGDCEGLRKSCQDSDVAVLEANMGEKTIEMHLNGEQAGKIAQEAGVKKLILTHIHSDTIKNYKPVEKAMLYFKGEVLLATDGLEIEI